MKKFLMLAVLLVGGLTVFGSTNTAEAGYGYGGYRGGYGGYRASYSGYRSGYGYGSYGYSSYRPYYRSYYAPTYYAPSYYAPSYDYGYDYGCGY